MNEVTDGILAMPFELAMGTEVARRQFHGCAVAEIERLKAELSSLWETVNNTIAKLGIDCVYAQNAPGKPSDVLAEHVKKLAAELECARGDLKTAMEIVERNQKDADRYRWLKEKGLHHSIDAATAAISPGVGPFICVQLPSSGAPNTVRLSASADVYVDLSMDKERT